MTIPNRRLSLILVWVNGVKIEILDGNGQVNGNQAARPLQSRQMAGADASGRSRVDKERLDLVGSCSQAPKAFCRRPLWPSENDHGDA